MIRIPTITINRNQLTFCSNNVTASASVDFYTSVTWSTDPNFNTIISDSLSFIYNQTEPVKWYYFKANYNFCFAVDSLMIQF
jgi:hypothetical protein